MKKLNLIVLSLLMSVYTFAQDTAPAANDMKMNIAIGVIGIILVVIFLFLFSMERRLKSLENKS